MSIQDTKIRAMRNALDGGGGTINDLEGRYWQGVLDGSIGSAINIPADNVFATEAERDAAIPNPEEGEQCAVQTGLPQYHLFQEYRGTEWVDITYIIKGPQGDVGDTGEYGQLVSVAIDGNDFVFTDNTGNTANLPNAVISLKGDKGDTGDTGEAGLIVSAEFDGNDIVFVDNSNNRTRLPDATTNLRGDRGPRGEKGEQGTPFIIQKQYSSVADMNADLAGVDVGLNEMVMIASGEGAQDNGEVYSKGDTQWNYITTLDGAASIQGVAGNDGVDGEDGRDGDDGASVESASVNQSGNLEIVLDNGASIDAGRVTGLSAYEVWLAEGNVGSEEDYIAYLRERITYDGADVEAVILGDDSGLQARVVNAELELSVPLVGDAVVDDGGLPPTATVDSPVRIVPFRYHPDMPQMMMVHTGNVTKVIDTFPNGSSYSLTPTLHGNSGLQGSAYTVSQGVGAEPSVDKYKSIPLFVFQPDSTVGFRDNFGFVSFPSEVEVDFSKGFYLTALMTGHYAGNTAGTSFLFVGNSAGGYQNTSGIGVYFDSAGCHVVANGSDTVISPAMTYNEQNGQPTFYRVAIYQLQDGTVHVHVRSCLTGVVVNQTVAGSVNTTNDAKVFFGCRRSGSTTTVGFGEVSLWIPETDVDIQRIQFRG